MEKQLMKRSFCDGVEILIYSNETFFDVIVNVSPEATKTQKIWHKNFIFKFKVMTDVECLNKLLHLKLEGIRYRSSIMNKEFVLNFKHAGEYQCKVFLKPELFVTEPARKSAEKRQRYMERQSKKTKGKYASSYRPGMSSSQAINYSSNNANHPYSGGSCTPK